MARLMLTRRAKADNWTLVQPRFDTPGGLLIDFLQGKNVKPVVSLVDDDHAILVALQRLLTLEGFAVYTYDSAEAFLDEYDETVPGCVIIDIKLPHLNGLQLQRKLTESGKLATVVFLTGTGDIPACVDAMKEGAVDFLTKPVDAEELLRAVRLAIEQDVIKREKQEQIQSLMDRLMTLSSREREVFEHVVKGEMNKEIAAQLRVVEKTIKVHRGRVIRKMGAQSLPDLVRMSELLGIGRGTG